MAVATDLLRAKTSPDKYRPEVARVVVTLVVIHLLRWTHPEPESSEFESALAPPGRDVEDRHPAGGQHSVNVPQRLLWLP